jgi:hypothetical protein
MRRRRKDGQRAKDEEAVVHVRAKIMIVITCILSAACAGSNANTSAASHASMASGRPSGDTVSPTETAVSPESPVPVESNPPGDIPDSIAFVPYRSAAGGLLIKTPEGWARTSSQGSVVFTDKLNTVAVTWAPANAPTVASAKKVEVPQLARTTRAFALKSVTTATLPAGPAVLVSYQANSDPNKVTGKQYREDVLRYELYHQGREVVLTLLSPVGADNVDPWRIVTQSLTWH